MAAFLFVSFYHCNKQNPFSPNHSRVKGSNAKNPPLFFRRFQLSACIPGMWRWWKVTDIHRALRKPFSCRSQKSEFFFAHRFSSLGTKCVGDLLLSVVERTEVLCTNWVRISTNVCVRTRSGGKIWSIPYSAKLSATGKKISFLLMSFSLFFMERTIPRGSDGHRRISKVRTKY